MRKASEWPEAPATEGSCCRGGTLPSVLCIPHPSGGNPDAKDPSLFPARGAGDERNRRPGAVLGSVLSGGVAVDCGTGGSLSVDFSTPANGVFSIFGRKGPLATIPQFHIAVDDGIPVVVGLHGPAFVYQEELVSISGWPRATTRPS